MNIPYSVTAPQLAWHILAGGNLSPTREGRCRICGGDLVGSASIHNPSPAWVDEYRCKAKHSSVVCEACRWATSKLVFRKILSLQKLALIISPNLKKVTIENKHTDEFFRNLELVEPPFLIAVKPVHGLYQKHLIFDMNVSWSKVQGYLTIMAAGDNFTLPIKFSRLKYCLDYFNNEFQGLAPDGKTSYCLNFGNDILWSTAYSLYRHQHNYFKVK